MNGGFCLFLAFFRSFWVSHPFTSRHSHKVPIETIILEYRSNFVPGFVLKTYSPSLLSDFSHGSRSFLSSNSLFLCLILRLLNSAPLFLNSTTFGLFLYLLITFLCFLSNLKNFKCILKVLVLKPNFHSIISLFLL